MPIPAEFSDTEHLQTTIKRYLNKQIIEDFRDLGGENWQPEVGTTRGSMRHALTHKDNDTMQITLGRMFLYYFTFGKARELQPPIYGVPVTTFQEEIKFYPQVRLLFLEDYSRVDEGYEQVKAEITIRLAKETETTMTPAKAKVLATKIKNLFATNNGFSWKKGHEKWTYYDKSKGYDLRVLAWNETEAKKIIEQVLDIQGHTPDWSACLGQAVKKRSFATIPGKHYVYGKLRRKPRDRPVAYVRFRYAELKIWGMAHDVTLVDLTGIKRNALVKA